MEVIVRSTEETRKLAEQLAKNTKTGDIIALYGDLGSGKTTFTKHLVEHLGSSSRVQSPTFVIHRVYESDNIKINHFDLYRLKSVYEVEDMGFEETLKDQNAVTIIEWPEVVERILEKYSDRLIKMKFTYLDEDERKIEIE